MNLRWAASSLVSCYHAVDALLDKRPLVDPALAEALAEPVANLDFTLTDDRVPHKRFLTHVAGLVTGLQSNLDLARWGLIKTIGRERAEPLTLKYRGLLIDLEKAFNAQVERLNKERPLQQERLQDEWYRHGPGLLAGVARLSDPAIHVEEATVLVVHPLLGGGGAAHVAYNSVRIEAVGEDPVPELPEVLRLCWLLSQLNLDLPRYSESFRSQDRASTLGPLALIPIVLTAAEELRLSTCSEPMMELALRTWLHQGEEAKAMASNLNGWYEVYRDTRPAWGTALGALDQLVAEEE